MTLILVFAFRLSQLWYVHLSESNRKVHVRCDSKMDSNVCNGRINKRAKITKICLKMHVHTVISMKNMQD